MSCVLYVRHLSGKLSLSEREDFLKHYGAERVWFINERSHTAFAKFADKIAATNALHRLHQMEVSGRRLVVEFSDEKEPPKGAEDLSTTVEAFKEFISRLNATNPYIGIYQPLPPNLRYNYPTATPNILFNIVYALAHNINFYVQTLHLMNKMALDPPFEDMNDIVREYIKKCLADIDIAVPSLQQLSSDESEMSSPEETQRPEAIGPLKRKRPAKRINRKIKIAPLQHPPPVVNMKPLDVHEVFENPTVCPKTKRIEINVAALPGETSTTDNESVVGTFGKMDLPKNVDPGVAIDPTGMLNEEKTITLEELLNNRLSSDDMKELPVFKNYQPGLPSMRLYIKNLSKNVTLEDVKAIYRRYISIDNPEDRMIFDVRVMQEGRMKGQAFVTLPSVEVSRRALDETNGFVLKDKPMVVQFARTANK